jgi:hypothetical protein
MSGQRANGAAGGRRAGTWILAFALTAGLAGLALSMLPGGEASSPRSGFSAAPRGRLFAYKLLDELGFHPRLWSEAPGNLARGRSLLWLAAEPPEPPKVLRELWKKAEDPQPGAGPRASTGRERDPRHYRRFVQEGGVLLASIADGRRAFLQDELGVEAIDALVLELAPGDTSDENRPFTQTVAAQGRERLTIEPALRTGPDFSGGAFEQRSPVVWIQDPERRATPLIADPDRPERAVAWRIALGRGAVVVLADDELFANRAIADADNGLYLVRLLEAIGSVDEVLFDEYALGAPIHPTALDLALAPGRAPITLHLLLALALWLWWLAWSSAFPRDPAEHSSASPVARATAFGATLARLGRHRELGEMLRRGVLARLPGARRARPGAELAGIAHAARDADELERWRRALSVDSVASADGLDAYARELAPIERLASLRLASGGRDLHNPGPSKARR